MNPCGSCTVRGLCCTYVRLPLARVLSQDEVHWLELHPGVQVHAGWLLHLEPLRCEALTEDGLCTLYGFPERPEMCSTWPDDPFDQTPEECEYRKMEVER